MDKDYKASEYYPTRGDAERLAEIGMFVSGYMERPKRSQYITKEHKESIHKIFKFIFIFIEEKEREVRNA